MTPKAFNKAMGAEIRKERLARGWGQEVLAKKLGVASQQISKYEQGDNGFSAHYLLKLARTLSIPIAELYRRAADPISNAKPTAADRDAFLASRHIKRVRDGKLRQAVIEFARAVSSKGVKA